MPIIYITKMEIQSVLFLKRKYSKAMGKMWLIHHHMNADYINKKESPRETRNMWRWRQIDPKDFIDPSFRTMDSGQEGIQFVIGKRK